MIILQKFFTICCHVYRMQYQCYGYEKFLNASMLLELCCFEGFSNQCNIDELVINDTNGCN